MALLKEIIDGAVDDDVRLQTLLRKCLILATQLKNERLRVWALSELNGYEDKQELPPYRSLDVHSKGFMLGPFQAQINDQPLAASVMKPEHREYATKAFMMEPIASYETMVSDKTDGSFRSYWTGDLVATYQTEFAEGWVLNRAWQEISTGTIVAIVDTVRTRLLQFALEIQEEIGVDSDNLARAAPEKVEHAVGTIIYGGQNVITGSVGGDVRLHAQQVVIQGDFPSLRRVLTEAGVAEPQIAELNEAEAADRAAGVANGFGQRVAGWLSKAGAHVTKKAGEATTDAAIGAVKTAVLTYFGLTP